MSESDHTISVLIIWPPFAILALNLMVILNPLAPFFHDAGLVLTDCCARWSAVSARGFMRTRASLSVSVLSVYFWSCISGSEPPLICGVVRHLRVMCIRFPIIYCLAHYLSLL